MPNDKARKLTDKQKIFVLEYMKDLNATQAAIRSGYSENAASEIGYENLNKPQIKDAIQHQMDQRSKATQITIESVLKKIDLIASANVNDAFDDKGAMKKICDMPVSLQLAISSIEIDELWLGSGADRIQIGETKKLKVWDKVKSLELLGRHLKMFTDKVAHEGEVAVKGITIEFHRDDKKEG